MVVCDELAKKGFKGVMGAALVAALIFLTPFVPGQLKIEAVVEVTFSLSPQTSNFP